MTEQTTPNVVIDTDETTSTGSSTTTPAKRRPKVGRILVVLSIIVLVALALGVFFTSPTPASDETLAQKITVSENYTRTAHGVLRYATTDTILGIQEDVRVERLEGNTLTFQSFPNGGELAYYEDILPENVTCQVETDPAAIDPAAPPAATVPVAITDLTPGDTLTVSWSESGAPTLVSVTSSAACSS